MIAGEALLFLTACLTGGGLGAVYDLFRAARVVVPAGRAAAFWEDGAFFAVFFAVNFLFFQRAAFGRLRLFLLVGEGLGFVVYYCTAGRAVYWLLGRAVGGVRRAGSAIVHQIRRKNPDKNMKKDEIPVK